MKASRLLDELGNMGIHTIAGVPDSTLKQFCDGIENYQGELSHYVAANEGAAVGLAIGSFLATGKPACVYMQNSGSGNAVNPLASLANGDVYGVPMLFVIGWRGEPGVKDEPQHVFQGKITCKLLDTLLVPYAVIDKETSEEEAFAALRLAEDTLKGGGQFALVIRKDTFEKEESYTWENRNTLVREEMLREILRRVPRDAAIVSTTGKISRELYEQSHQMYGNHENLFMTVGGMGHASMIALGIAKKRPDKRVVCIDGDGAVLMHMGALPFIASQKPENFCHIVINNQAHESVGAMPTGCQGADFSNLAKAAGYVHAGKLERMEDLEKLSDFFMDGKGPVLFEIPVSLSSRLDLGRPKESAKENKESFMEFLNGID